MNKLFLIIIAAFGSLSCDKATGDSPELTPADYSGYPLVSAVHYRNGTATVGDLIPYYYNGEYHLDEAIRLVKKNSRRYAKRQLTWFKRYKDMQWFDISTYENDEACLKEIYTWLEKN